MNEFTQGILTALIPSVVVSFFTAWLTVKFSMGQFCSQRWWERKAEAYSHIIEELSYLQYCLGEWFDASLEGRKFSDEKKVALSEGFRRAEESITKAVAMGTYIISKNSVETLKQLLKELAIRNSDGDWMGDMDNHYGAVKECIENIREYAKKDLEHR